MTPEKLAELEALANAATPGPWTVTEWNIEGPDRDDPGETMKVVERRLQNDEDADNAFIAASRTAVPELVAEVRRLAAENRALKEALETTLPHVKKAVWCANCARDGGYECPFHGWNKSVENDYYSRLVALSAPTPEKL